MRVIKPLLHSVCPLCHTSKEDPGRVDVNVIYFLYLSYTWNKTKIHEQECKEQKSKANIRGSIMFLTSEGHIHSQTGLSHSSLSSQCILYIIIHRGLQMEPKSVIALESLEFKTG
jgi:hypothetical protein